MEKSLSAYRNAGLDASIAGASPHHLVLMLFQGARIALGQARRAIADGNTPARAHALSKAAAIIDDGLKSSLDLSKGGALAAQLDSLYDYMVLGIARANADADASKIEEIDRLLAGLEESWRQIGAQGRPAPDADHPAPGAPALRGSLTYGRV